MAAPTTEIMEDFDEKALTPAPAPAEKAPAPEPEFDPEKEIAALDEKYFRDLNANPGLSNRDRLRSAQGFLANSAAIREQRANLEKEKQESVINGLRAKQLEGSINEYRSKAQEAQNLAQNRSQLSESVKGVMFDPKLTPDQKRDYVNAIHIQNNATVSSDPTLKSVFDNARDMLPKKKFAEDMSDTLQAQVGEAMANAKDADELASINKLSDDPKALGFYLAIQKNRKALAEKDEEVRETNRKELRASVVKLASELPKFMDEKEREENRVDPGDKNPYLTPDSQTRLKTLIGVTRGAKGLEEYEKLDDRGRYEMGMQISIEALKGQIEDQENSKKPVIESKVDKLVPQRK